MKSGLVCQLVIFLALLSATAVRAETLYLSNQLQVGLHEEKDLDSPITKILPSGTQLELVKRETNVSFVRDSRGANGWIDNSYLTDADPTNGQLRATQKRLTNLQNQLDESKKQVMRLQTQKPDSAELQNLRQSQSELQTQLKSEKLKAGQLEAEISKLRKRVGQNNDNESLYTQIDQLQADKKNLEVELAIAQGGDGQASSRFSNNGPGWRNLIIYLIITMLIGIGVGVYIMDFLNRRRHGGFRV